MSALGEKFRLAREARGFSLSDVGEKIHIRSVYLDAIERGDWAAIGAPVYVRGFIRTYARFLGLDAEEAVAGFSAEIGTLAVDEAAAAPASAERPSLVVWAAAAVALALVLYAAYAVYQWKTAALPAPPAAGASPAGGSPAALPAAAVAASPVTAPAPAATAPAKAGVALRFTDRSWVRVAVDGATLMQGEFPAGTERSFHGKAITVRLGNAGGVDLSVDGKILGKLGNAGDVVERTFKPEQE